MNTEKLSNEETNPPLRKGDVMPCFIRSLKDLDSEEWRDCIGYDGMYSISNYGRIKSERRYSCIGRLIKEKILKQTISSKGIPSVKLSFDGVATTKSPFSLVGESFLLEKKHDEECCHKNKNPLDNRLSNIMIAKRSESKSLCYKLGIQSDWGIGENSKKTKEIRSKEFDVFENGILNRRICSCCFKELDIDCFYPTSKPDFFRNDCKDCVKTHLGVIEVGKHLHRMEMAKAGLRYCSSCKKLKSLDNEYDKAKNRFMGKSNNCKSCVKYKNDAYRLKNKA